MGRGFFVEEPAVLDVLHDAAQLLLEAARSGKQDHHFSREADGPEFQPDSVVVANDMAVGSSLEVGFEAPVIRNAHANKDVGVLQDGFWDDVSAVGSRSYSDKVCGLDWTPVGWQHSGLFKVIIWER